MLCREGEAPAEPLLYRRERERLGGSLTLPCRSCRLGPRAGEERVDEGADLVHVFVAEGKTRRQPNGLRRDPAAVGEIPLVLAVRRVRVQRVPEGAALGAFAGEEFN